jgi:hypothetical protein
MSQQRAIKSQQLMSSNGTIVPQSFVWVYVLKIGIELKWEYKNWVGNELASNSKKKNRLDVHDISCWNQRVASNSYLDVQF